MADYSSELPIRSNLPGQVAPDDVIVKLGDATNPTTQLAKVDANGSQYNVLADSAGNLIGDQNLSSSYWLQMVMPSNGPASPGTAATFSNLAGGIYHSTPPTLTNGQQASLQLDSAGRLLVDSAVIFPYDENYGTVGATTLRTAAQIGNATGAADFGAGATDAQTLRVAANTYDGSGNPISSTGGALNVYATQGTSPWIVKDQADGSATGGTAGSFSQLAGGIYNSTPPTLTTGQQASLQLDSAGRLLVDANVIFPYDENWGTVGATTLRAAAEIGNATGAADFNWGTVGAQTLRVAAELGNATGLADFGAGATDAQTLRTTSNQGTPNTAANAWPITITSGGAANGPTNPVYVTTEDVIGTPVNVYTDSASVAAKASVNVDYTVSAGKTFYTDQIWATASGLMKVQVQYETAAASGIFNTFWVGFNSTATPVILIPVPNRKTQVTGARIRLIVQNLDQAAMDLYTTLSGTEQ